MPEDSPSLIGHIIDVQGSVFLTDLKEQEESVTPTVTIGDEDIVVGRLGSYVRVEQGKLGIIAIVARMREREKLPSTSTGNARVEEDQEPLAVRTMQLVPIGSLNSEKEFERGVSAYPTTGAEVHVIGRDELARMFRRFQDRGYDVGALSSNPDLRVHLDPSPLFGPLAQDDGAERLHILLHHSLHHRQFATWN